MTKIKELREKTDVELVELKDKLVKEMYDIRFKRVLNVVENPLRIRYIRKDIAKINMLIHERKLAKIAENL